MKELCMYTLNVLSNVAMRSPLIRPILEVTVFFWDRIHPRPTVVDGEWRWRQYPLMFALVYTALWVAALIAVICFFFLIILKQLAAFL